MAKNIYVLGGSKGGVGKSFGCMSVLDHFRDMGEKPLLIETDTSNPDVFHAYGKLVEHRLIDLDKADGWIDLVNVCDAFPDSPVVVNTAARNNRGVTAYGRTLNNTLEELKRRLVTFWVINRQRDSLELLRQYMVAIPNAAVHVVRNAYWGTEEQFELYNNSKTRQEVEGRGGKSLTLPNLADRVVDDIYSKRLAIEKALVDLPVGHKAELRRWKEDLKPVLSAVIE